MKGTTTSPSKFHSEICHDISSSYTRKVNVTTNIPGRLPNTIYTLPFHLVQAITCRADVENSTSQAMFAICRKFSFAQSDFDDNKLTDDDQWSTLTTYSYCGRVYAEGSNVVGECGIGSEEHEVTRPRLVRLPPVLQVWCGNRTTFAKTARGLYAWGDNSMGQLGVSSPNDYESLPCRLPLTVDICSMMDRTFFRPTPTSDWLATGANYHGASGVGPHQHRLIKPAVIPQSGRVDQWTAMGMTTFGWINGQDGAEIVACGNNEDGQAGVDDFIDAITTLTPVALPEDVKGRVDRIITDNNQSAFFICGRRCFACGNNESGQLGLGTQDAVVMYPAELPVPVDDLLIFGADTHYTTVIRSGNELLACGSNHASQIMSGGSENIHVPVRFGIPNPVVKIVGLRNNIFVQLADGGFFGRGVEHSRYFFHTSAKTDDSVTEWRQLRILTCAELFMSKNCPMVLPEPIGPQ